MRPYQCGPLKREWINVSQPGFIVTTPEGPPLRCEICEISDTEVTLDVGLVTVPQIFALMLTPKSKNPRAYSLQWRGGSMVRAKLLSAREIRRRSAEVQTADWRP